MKLTRNNVLNLALIVAAFAMTAALYDRLPNEVPTHWNASGQVDGTMPKPLGPFVLPLTLAGMYVLFTVLPRVSPRGFKLDQFADVYRVLTTAIMLFLFMVTTVALLAGIGVPLPIERVVPAGVGLLFAVLGNFMGKVRKNFFVGIRTPWTLASDEVWLRTHRLGGRLFVLAGLIMIVSAFAGLAAPAFVAVMVAAVIPAVYSYVLYRRLEGFKNGGEGSHSAP